MGLLKSIERLKRMDHLIQNEVTGTAEEFAGKVNISRSMLMENIREMRDLGAKIDFCPRRQSYCYLAKFAFIIGSEDAKN